MEVEALSYLLYTEMNEYSSLLYLGSLIAYEVVKMMNGGGQETEVPCSKISQSGKRAWVPILAWTWHQSFLIRTAPYLGAAALAPLEQCWDKVGVIYRAAVKRRRHPMGFSALPCPTTRHNVRASSMLFANYFSTSTSTVLKISSPFFKLRMEGMAGSANLEIPVCIDFGNPLETWHSSFQIPYVL